MKLQKAVKPKIDSNAFQYLKYDATKEQLNRFSELVSMKASETELHNFLDENRELFSFALQAYNTGHHGSIVLSKQNIKPHFKHDASKGLIPDFIVGGDSSDGFEWWVIELKGANENVFKSDGEHVYFSATTNKGIFQLLEYLDFCSESQTYMRDTMKLPNFREPKGLIIIGTEDEFEDDRKQKLKAAWNRMLPKQLEIRSYSWLLNTFKHNDEHFNFRKDKSEPSGF